MTISDEVYPNSPLTEVVFEMRFLGEMAIECRRHEFWEKIRDEYPHIFVPKNEPDQHMALQPYRFVKEDRSSGVMIALNRFGYFASKYPGHKAFQQEFLRLSGLFGRIFPIDRLTRVGWRYVNLIPFVRENGLIPLDQFLKLGFKVPTQVPERFKAVSLVFESELDGGLVTTRLETVKKSDGEQEAMLLDFDYGKESDLHFSNVEAYMREAHEFTRQLFEDLITDDYRRYLQGDVIS